MSDAGGDSARGDRGAWLRLFPADGRPWQRSLRWTPPPRDRRRLAICLALAVLVTLIELTGFGIGMRPRELDGPRNAVQVELIAPTVLPPIPPEPVPPVFVQHVHKVRVAPPETRIRPPPEPVAGDENAMRARIGSAGAPAVRLFNPDGSIQLPAPAAPARPANPQEAGEARWVEIEKRGDNPLDCRRTRFAAAYKADQSLGDEIAGKYLKWIGLGDSEAVAHRAAQRERRAAEGCDPAR